MKCLPRSGEYRSSRSPPPGKRSGRGGRWEERGWRGRGAPVGWEIACVASPSDRRGAAFQESLDYRASDRSDTGRENVSPGRHPGGEWHPMERYRHQVVWITGASSGIGEALAVAWSREGARVVLSARNRAELERVRGNCANPDAHVVLPLDLKDVDAINAAATQVLR